MSYNHFQQVSDFVGTVRLFDHKAHHTRAGWDDGGWWGVVLRGGVFFVTPGRPCISVARLGRRSPFPLPRPQRRRCSRSRRDRGHRPPRNHPRRRTASTSARAAASRAGGGAPASDSASAAAASGGGRVGAPVSPSPASPASPSTTASVQVGMGATSFQLRGGAARRRTVRRCAHCDSKRTQNKPTHHNIITPTP